MQAQAIADTVLSMHFDNSEGLRTAGFEGFESIAELRASSLAEVPTAAGVYLVLRPAKSNPMFLEKSPAGWLKGRNPGVPVEELRRRWVRGTPVLYIGKAGGVGMKATLRGRLGAYLRHGAGHRSRHWGGRYVWQLDDAEKLLLAWLATPDREPRELEKELIRAFVEAYGVRPFANRVG